MLMRAYDAIDRAFGRREGLNFSNERLAVLRAAAPERRRTGRPTELEPGHLREVAAVYQANAGRGGTPVRAVQERFGISRAAAAGRVQKARQAGLLPPTDRKRGK
jgi:hypothetical protein